MSSTTGKTIHQAPVPQIKPIRPTNSFIKRPGQNPGAAAIGHSPSQFTNAGADALHKITAHGAPNSILVTGGAQNQGAAMVVAGENEAQHTAFTRFAERRIDPVLSRLSSKTQEFLIPYLRFAFVELPSVPGKIASGVRILHSLGFSGCVHHVINHFIGTPEIRAQRKVVTALRDSIVTKLDGLYKAGDMITCGTPIAIFDNGGKKLGIYVDEFGGSSRHISFLIYCRDESDPDNIFYAYERTSLETSGSIEDSSLRAFDSPRLNPASDLSHGVNLMRDIDSALNRRLSEAEIAEIAAIRMDFIHRNGRSLSPSAPSELS